MSQTAHITVAYVNPRKDTRPPSIKADNGTYYTVADEAIGLFQQGASGELGFYVNQKGYSTASHWLGAELPSKDKPGSSQDHSGYSKNPPKAVPEQPQPQASHKDQMIWRTAIAKSCIEAGRSSADADHWWEWLNGHLSHVTGATKEPTDEQAQGLTNEVLSDMDHFAH